MLVKTNEKKADFELFFSAISFSGSYKLFWKIITARKFNGVFFMHTHVQESSADVLPTRQE